VRPLCLAFALVTAAAAGLHAASPSSKAFLASQEEILILATERTRTAHVDYQRTLKTAEDRLRRLHEEFRVAGGTPPVDLDGDVQSLRVKTQKVRLHRTRGRPLAADPRAEELIFRYWSDYKQDFEKIERDIQVHRRIGSADSQAYWDIMKRFAELRERTQGALIHNAPPGQASLDEVLSRAEWRLLKAVENPSVKTRGRPSCVSAPEEHPRDVKVEAAPFYGSQGLLPTLSPQRVGAFRVMPGCRTVTKRESGLKMILRVSSGKGVAYMGGQEQELLYGYVAIPPDVPYYFENTSTDPLDLEYIALPM
jgi:mannose-6-phosphate isomerase-like protein (cupin superfamily)